MSEPIQSVFELPAVQPSTPRPAADSPGRALAAAARNLLPVLEAGHRLVAPIVTTAVDDAWQAVDSERASWNSKCCYDTAEAATVLFLRNWGASMLKTATDAEDLLRMIQRIASLEPTHTHRSEHQVAFDQFSTPLALACAAHLAAAVHPADVVLEPSAGTGVLAALPGTVLDRPSQLHLNELSDVRRALLAVIYDDASVTRHNAEQIRDRLPHVRPNVVLMNPPSAARPTVGKRRRHVDLTHIKSAYAALAPYGRLVAIVGANCIPDSTAWRDALGSGAAAPRILFAGRVPRSVYQRRGTGVETRFLVLERAPAERYPDVDPFAIVDDLEELVGLVAALPPRLSLDPGPRGLDIEEVDRDPQEVRGSDATWSQWAPPRWPTSPHPSPSTAPSCRRSSPSTACCPTRSSKASPWPDTPTNACCPPATASTPTTSARSPSTTTATRWTPPSRSTRHSRNPSSSARAGCSATAPAAARDARPPR